MRRVLMSMNYVYFLLMQNGAKPGDEFPINARFSIECVYVITILLQFFPKQADVFAETIYRGMHKMFIYPADNIANKFFRAANS